MLTCEIACGQSFERPTDPPIALDAMGGDDAPAAIVAGAVLAAADLGIRVALVGKPDALETELAKQTARSTLITVVPASETIEMDERPPQAARHKKDSSIVVGCAW